MTSADASDSAPSWKRLFGPGGFAWSMRMRPGDARAFFAPQGDPWLEEKQRLLDEVPDRHVLATPGAASLVHAVCELAVGWGQMAADGGDELMRLAREWEPDILILDGPSMALVAGCVCMPSSWALERRIGQPVQAIHDLVPRLNPEMGEQISRFLGQIPPGKAFQRENWSLARTDHRNYHPALERPRLDASVTPDALFLRIEHQLFTAIPGGVLMGLRIETCPLGDLRADPATWANLTEIIRSMPDDVARYKSMLDARDPLAAAMAR